MEQNNSVQLLTICKQLNMRSTNGKYYKTDVADIESILLYTDHKNNHTAMTLCPIFLLDSLG